MHRSLILVALVAMTLTLLATAPVVARRPVALGIASQNSTDLAALDASCQGSARRDGRRRDEP